MRANAPGMVSWGQGERTQVDRQLTGEGVANSHGVGGMRLQ
jgi:hypothetical protein